MNYIYFFFSIDLLIFTHLTASFFNAFETMNKVAAQQRLKKISIILGSKVKLVNWATLSEFVISRIFFKSVILGNIQGCGTLIIFGIPVDPEVVIAYAKRYHFLLLIFSWTFINFIKYIDCP